MIKEINDILSQFRSCFSRESSFNWFVITVIGFIVRLDHHGVSSVIRWLNLDPGKYTSLLFFSRASSWNLKEIQQKWWQIVLNTCPIITIKGRYLTLVDTELLNTLYPSWGVKFKNEYIEGLKLIIKEHKSANAQYSMEGQKKTTSYKKWFSEIRNNIRQ